MTGLHEALDDIAAEITPIDPPVGAGDARGRQEEAQAPHRGHHRNGWRRGPERRRGGRHPGTDRPGVHAGAHSRDGQRRRAFRWRGRSCLSRRRAARRSTGTLTW